MLYYNRCSKVHELLGSHFITQEFGVETPERRWNICSCREDTWHARNLPEFPCLNCGGGDRLVSPSIVPSRYFAELIRTVTCMVLKANDRRTSSPLLR
ncbi:hypothetical protein TNCV_1957521 [Trichonephila clavipes]|nr:hypothetical protein TNCV_1957521 [Trichonephila clavipes]